MSQSNIPNVTPDISVIKDEGINLLLSSIALEELGMSHILNAEGEKIQFGLAALSGFLDPIQAISLIEGLNKNVTTTITALTKHEFLLDCKLAEVLSEIGTD